MAEPGLYEQLLRRARLSATKPPHPSAAVVPWRRIDDTVEVYWVRRNPTLRFMGGWWAFPGGGLDRGDAARPITGMPTGVDDESLHPPSPERSDTTMTDPDLVPGLLACAARELFEEVGLLLDPRSIHAHPHHDEPHQLRAARLQLEAGKKTFGDLLIERGWSLTADELVFAGRWLTPPFAPRRFDNRFFLLEWPLDRAVQPAVDGGELVEGEWIRPTDAIDRWHRGDVTTAPPILHILRVLASDGPEAGLARLRDTRDANLGTFRHIEFRPGILTFPLITPTLPPAVGTNCYVVGTEHAVVVDPACADADEALRLTEALEEAAHRGHTVKAIWLTHHHPDHIGGVEHLRERLELPVLAHRESEPALLRQGIRLDAHLEDGSRHDVGAGHLRVVHTPGHARGHLAFFHEPTKSLLCGDLASTLSTIVIDPPEGDMDAYLHSLEHAASLGPEVLMPAHGPIVLGATHRLRTLRAHRLDREAKILEAFRAGATTAEAMVATVYDDVPSPLHGVALRQIEAHLDRLKRLGELA
ncbi:MAG: MBL fold metallo-hydrolase [Acidobacteriota bacterium]